MRLSLNCAKAGYFKFSYYIHNIHTLTPPHIYPYTTLNTLTHPYTPLHTLTHPYTPLHTLYPLTHPYTTTHYRYFKFIYQPTIVKRLVNGIEREIKINTDSRDKRGSIGGGGRDGTYTPGRDGTYTPGECRDGRESGDKSPHTGLTGLTDRLHGLTTTTLDQSSFERSTSDVYISCTNECTTEERSTEERSTELTIESSKGVVCQVDVHDEKLEREREQEQEHVELNEPSYVP